jgi:hypothetical protein
MSSEQFIAIGTALAAILTAIAAIIHELRSLNHRIDGRMDQLVALTAKMAHAEGVKLEHDNPT